jgi:UDP-2,4-diacetamido-2,4,6-trideoxy-beta-L-altropyranose hydrolase
MDSVVRPCVVIRADASRSIGTGHVMRCITLADFLAEIGADVVFLCRHHEGNLCGLIEQRGYRVRGLETYGGGSTLAGDLVHSAWLGVPWEEDARQSRLAIESLHVAPDMLIVDHYALDQRWERALRASVRRIMVVDDLADRPHDCDILLDQSLDVSPASRYAGLLASSTKAFFGPQYAVLRHEFDEITPRVRNAGVVRMLVFIGGVDPTHEVLKLVNAVRALGGTAPRTIFVLGPMNEDAEQIRREAREIEGATVIGMTAEMAKLMSEADLAIGTCGGAALERCATGLPALVVINAENQRHDTRMLHELGAVRHLGDATNTSSADWVEAIRDIAQHPETLMKMSRAALAIVQGRQTAVGRLKAAIADAIFGCASDIAGSR